jgi:hypothetical protein
MYEIQHLTFCDGYVNTWLDDDENPIVFRTFAEARGELDQYLRDLAREGGHYSADSFRIMEVTQ